VEGTGRDGVGRCFIHGRKSTRWGDLTGLPTPNGSKNFDAFTSDNRAVDFRCSGGWLTVEIGPAGAPVNGRKIRLGGLQTLACAPTRPESRRRPASPVTAKLRKRIHDDPDAVLVGPVEGNQAGLREEDAGTVDYRRIKNRAGACAGKGGAGTAE
jgi:hypothetical protein